MNNEVIIRDFDRIASVAEQFGSGSDQYDDFICRHVPAGADHIADIGCGLGRLSLKLADNDRNVTGIDLSPEMIARAKKNTLHKSNITFLCGDFLTDERLHQYDCVVTAATLHHVDLETGVCRLKELVRDGGRLIIHDLRDNTTILEDAKAFLVLAETGFRRLIRTGSPLRPREVKRAWDEHGSNENYLTISDVKKMTKEYLPGARVNSHWGWRYTVVWDKG